MAKKRTLTTLSMLLVVGVLFTCVANAAGAELAVRTTASYTSGSVGIYVTAMQFYPTINTSLPSGGDQVTLISIRVNNTNSQAAKLSYIRVLPWWGSGDDPYVVGYENYSEDLFLQNILSNGKFNLAPAAGYSYNTDIVIPPNTSLYALFAVYTMANFNTQNQNTTGAVLSSIAVDSDLTITYGDYPYSGSGVDLSGIETLLTNINTNVDGVEGLLTDIYTYLGTLHTDLTSVNTKLTTLNNTITSVTNLYLQNISSNTNHIVDQLQDILDSMGAGDYSDTIDDSEDLQTTEQQIHAQEAQWYSDNQTAIEATGLGNYQYSQGLINSFGAARYQIAQLWNALGDWTYVYYLVFLLGLATYILRHEPSMRVKQLREDREIDKVYTQAGRNVRMRRDVAYRHEVYHQYGERILKRKR